MMNIINNAKDGTFKKLSIIIVNYNGRDYLKDCLNSLKKFPLPDLKEYDFDIVIIDNASTDGSVEMTEKFFPGMEVIKNSKNEGFAAANNIGIKKTFSEYILLLNSDCEVYRDSLLKLVDFMDKKKDAGVAGPKILNSDGSLQLSCRKFPSIIDAAMHSLIGGFKPDNPFSRRYQLADICKDETFVTDWVSGSCMIIRREALKSTGLMDEKYFMYVEDTDLCYQMWQKNWKVYYYPESIILHHWGKSTKKGSLSSSIMMQKSAAYFFRKNNRRSSKILLYPLILVVLGARILLNFVKNLLK
jgi:GT2 family glycosyltransferase